MEKYREKYIRTISEFYNVELVDIYNNDYEELKDIIITTEDRDEMKFFDYFNELTIHAVFRSHDELYVIASHKPHRFLTEIDLFVLEKAE